MSTVGTKPKSKTPFAEQLVQRMQPYMDRVVDNALTMFDQALKKLEKFDTTKEKLNELVDDNFGSLAGMLDKVLDDSDKIKKSQEEESEKVDDIHEKVTGLKESDEDRQEKEHRKEIEEEERAQQEASERRVKAAQEQEAEAKTAAIIVSETKSNATARKKNEGLLGAIQDNITHKFQQFRDFMFGKQDRIWNLVKDLAIGAALFFTKFSMDDVKSAMAANFPHLYQTLSTIYGGIKKVFRGVQKVVNGVKKVWNRLTAFKNRLFPDRGLSDAEIRSKIDALESRDEIGEFIDSLPNDAQKEYARQYAEPILERMESDEINAAGEERQKEITDAMIEGYTGSGHLQYNESGKVVSRIPGLADADPFYSSPEYKNVRGAQAAGMYGSEDSPYFKPDQLVHDTEEAYQQYQQNNTTVNNTTVIENNNIQQGITE